MIPVRISDSVSQKQHVDFVVDTDAKFRQLGQLALSGYGRAFLFVDSSVRLNWLPLISAQLAKRLPIAAVHFIVASEAAKGMDTFGECLDALSQQHCSKDDIVVAIGGGVVLDVVSFLASVYMRGVPLLLIPTTLIGQVDAATAGKTCLNTPHGKNLLGTLYLPNFVYNNVRVLGSSSPFHLRQGYSEIFKYGLLGSKRLIRLLEEHRRRPSDMAKLAIVQAETIRVRLKLRKRDPLASNLGHTFGHAIEKHTNFAVGHGDAIAAGTVLALEFSRRQGLISQALVDTVVDQMEQLGLNTCVQDGMDAGELTALMLRDKKSSGKDVRLVLIESIGVPLQTNGSPFTAFPPEEIRAFWRTTFAEGRRVRKGHWATLSAGK